MSAAAAAARAARGGIETTGEKWKRVKVSFAKEEKKKKRDRKNALWEKSPRARPLANDLRVKPTAAATQQLQPRESARLRA